MTINLINNIAFLVALAATGQILLSLLRHRLVARQLTLGLLFGSVALLAMANPLTFMPGVIFDGRSIVLAVAGVVGGGLTAYVAAALAGAYRLYLGGAGAPVGVAVVVLSAMLGVLARWWWSRRPSIPGALDFWGLGVVVQLMQLAAFTQIPNGAGYPFIQQAWWVLLLAYPVATMLLCLMFRNYEQQLHDRLALRSAQAAQLEQERASLQRFHAYFDQSIVGLAITSLEKGWLEVNDALCATLGYSKAELLQMSWTELTHPDDLAPDLEQFQKMLAGEIDHYAMDKRFVHRDGHVVYTRLAVSHVRKPDGRIDYVLAMVEDITERKQAEMALTAEKQLSQDILNALPGIFYMFDTQNRLVRWNHQFSVISGYSDDELQHMQGMVFFSGPDKRRVADAAQRARDDGQTDLEADLKTKDGRRIPYHFTGRVTHLGDQTYLLGVGVDIGKQRKAQEVLETERAHLRTLVNAIPDLVWLKDMQGVYLSCNPEFERFFGAPEAEIVGKTDDDFVPPEVARAFREQDRRVATSKEPAKIEEWISYASDGRTVLLETTKVPILTTDRKVVGVLGIGHDISERQAHQKQLERIAHYDMLTGLPNRILLADRLKQAVAHAQRTSRKMAVVYIDLDGFKAINDRHGHEAGDELLKALSDHMRGALRETDTLARLGGDEFVAILQDLADAEAAAPLLERLLGAAREVFEDQGRAMQVTASMGVALYPQADAVDADQLLRQADQAMYQAKLAGKNRYTVFDEQQDRTVRGRHEGAKRIQQALEAREFVLHYQPKVNMRSGEVVGVEALVRWAHPERGLLPPATFLPLIADGVWAIELGNWVIDEALSQVEAWRALSVRLPVSVNVDAVQIEQPDFVDQIRKHLSAHPKIQPGDLELEVLESSALNDMSQATRVVSACRELGVAFALDDFGTGYSSLTYLKRLHASVLKIDQSFVRDMMDDPDDLAILEGVLGLAKSFQRQAIAEGVETSEQGEMLLCLGCEWAQGYAIARPMPAEAVLPWMEQWRAPDSWRTCPELDASSRVQLMALVEFRSWLKTATEYAQGALDTPPPVPSGLSASPWLAETLAHERDLALELMGLRHQGKRTAGDPRWATLQSARDAMWQRFVGTIKGTTRHA